MEPMLLSIGLLILAIALIYLGARWLVDGASELAAYFGVSSIIIGLTVVGMGTSAPELMLAIISGVEGVGSISAGNVFGANIANATYVIGASIIALPIVVKFKEIRREALFLFAALLITTFMALDGTISRLEGIFLILLSFALMILTLRTLRNNRVDSSLAEEFESIKPDTKHPLKSALLVIIGLAILIVGTDLAVDSATEIATVLGVSEFLIGLTIMTFGTTTPEFAASLIASLRGNSDLALGNILGTMFFNATIVLGTASAISPLIISSDQLLFGVLAQLAIGSLMLAIIYRKNYLTRPLGVALVLLYIIYISAVLILT
ncbi:MAG: calcium/sodium antiporter [Euryarchaeota archaeon]|nr:calcium/sodium antiporter [Euryarchaeota archaeon]